jgi:hypothetical protein
LISHFFYNTQSFFILQCSVILVNSVILHATMLSYFSESSHSSCYSTQLFFNYYNAHSFLFAIALSHSSLLQCSVIPCYSELRHFCYNTQPFYDFVSHSQDFISYFAQPYSTILQNCSSFLRFHRPFSRMADTGAGTWGGSAARSGHATPSG